NDPQNQEHVVEVVTQILGPRIQVTPDRTEGVNFGQVDQGGSETRPISITNVGPLPLVVDQITLSGNMAEFELVGVPELPFTINDSTETLDFQVRYSPETLGEDLGSILISSNDPIDANYELPILANSTTPCIRVTPEFVEFSPAVAIGDVKARQVTVESCGAVALQISELIRMPGGSQENLIEDATPDTFTGLTLEPGEVEILEILYAPVDENVDAAEFLIRSIDPLRGEVTVSVLGSGTSNQCPLADAKGRVAGSTVLEEQVAAVPLDTLVLDGTMSADPESSVEEWIWEITEAPDGSTTQIAAEGNGLTRLLLNLAGDYTV